LMPCCKSSPIGRERGTEGTPAPKEKKNDMSLGGRQKKTRVIQYLRRERKRRSAISPPCKRKKKLASVLIDLEEKKP